MIAAPQSAAVVPAPASSRAEAWLDHFRVPYEVRHDPVPEGLEQLRWSEGGPALLWPEATRLEGCRAAVAALTVPEGQSIPVFGRLLGDEAVRPLLPGCTDAWAPGEALVGPGGERVASIWHAADGSILLPFEPDEIRVNFLSERYAACTDGSAGGVRKLAVRAFYQVRSFIPRRLQIWLRRRYAVVQARRRFPRWPIEPALHDFLEFLFGLAQSMSPEPVPRIAPWPGGKTWALVLTHDVETSLGLGALDPVLELERSLGMRSSWNFVPERDYRVSAERVSTLVADGFEVGVHGLYHDGRDLESAATLGKRLPGMRSAAECWGAAGFRSPATHRDWELMPTLGFDYDSSYPDTDPFEPQSGGCCSWLPFFIDGMVELPLTMPQDHTLFTILQQADETAWVQKAEALRARGGMALIDTHPDYLVKQKLFAAYAGFLRRFAADDDVWIALPSEVNAWWRRRAASRLERTPAGWSVTGPAACEARVEFASPRSTTTADARWEGCR